MAIVVRRVWQYAQWLYFQYCIHLGVNTFEPWEVRIFNSLIVLMVCCTIYTTYLFMPGHIHMWIDVFRWASGALLESAFGSAGSSAVSASGHPCFQGGSMSAGDG